MLELKRILLVEDSVNDVELTLSALSSINLANVVDVVEDGIEAMDYLQCRGKFSERPNYNPIVVLLDLKLPKKNGLELLKEIRQDSDLKHVPVVMLTSSREEGDLLASYEAGANAYVVKPIEIKEFIMAIKEIGSFWAVMNEVPLAR
jgi:CheY-like chemotaxis protein